jgi:hypothetical protein
MVPCVVAHQAKGHRAGGLFDFRYSIVSRSVRRIRPRRNRNEALFEDRGDCLPGESRSREMALAVGLHDAQMAVPYVQTLLNLIFVAVEEE